MGSLIAILLALGASGATARAVTFDDPAAGSQLSAQADGFSPQFERRQARIVDHPVRAGEHAARFVLERRSDNFDGPRAELADDDVLTGERWYGFSVRLDRSWARDRAPDIVSQWHGVGPEGDTGSPSLSIETQDGRWMIGRNPDNDYSDTPVGRYTPGRWTDWVVHVRWAYDRTGFVRIWRDGDVVYDRRRVQTGYTGHPGTYFKFGIYKWPWGEGERSDTRRRVMVFDELRIAGARGSYASVDPAP